MFSVVRETEKRIPESQQISAGMLPVLGHFPIMSKLPLMLLWYAVYYMRYCRYGVLGYCHHKQKMNLEKRKEEGKERREKKKRIVRDGG